MSRQYFDLSALVAAAAACNCTAHLHQDAQGNPVFSIGSENLGAAEFNSYPEALAWATDRSKHTAADCAEQAGGTIAHTALNDMLAGDSQAKRYAILKAAILDIAKLQHFDRAAGGLAVAMVSVIETGLQHLPKVAE
jgi:hypothetical protein